MIKKTLTATATAILLSATLTTATPALAETAAPAATVSVLGGQVITGTGGNTAP